MLSKAELQRLAKRNEVALGVLEKDYVLTEVLKALSQMPMLNSILVFKEALPYVKPTSQTGATRKTWTSP